MCILLPRLRVGGGMVKISVYCAECFTLALDMRRAFSSARVKHCALYIEFYLAVWKML